MTITNEEIKDIWHSIPTQGDSSGMKFAIAFARAVLAAAPASQGAPKQHFCEKPVAWTDQQMVAFAGFSLYSVSLQHLSIAERLEHFRNRPSDGAQAAVVGKPTPQEDK